MWQAEAKAADAQEQLVSLQDASRTVEQKLREQHIKVVENFREQLTKAKVQCSLAHFSLKSSGILFKG